MKIINPSAKMQLAYFTAPAERAEEMMCTKLKGGITLSFKMTRGCGLK